MYELNNNKKNDKEDNKIKKQKPNFLCKYCNSDHIRLHRTSSNGKKRYRCMNFFPLLAIMFL